MRDELKEFANEMELVLRENDKKGSWKECSLNYLDSKLIEEVCEYLIINHQPLEILQSMCGYLTRAEDAKEDREFLHEEERPTKEITDIANVCMMIFDNNS